MCCCIFVPKLGRGLSLLILGNVIAKIADLGSKKAGLSSHFWENCMILKKISFGKWPFFGVCYISRKNHWSPTSSFTGGDYYTKVYAPPVIPDIWRNPNPAKSF
jgi:hypothetical protein